MCIPFTALSLKVIVLPSSFVKTVLFRLLRLLQDWFHRKSGALTVNRSKSLLKELRNFHPCLLQRKPCFYDDTVVVLPIQCLPYCYRYRRFRTIIYFYGIKSAEDSFTSAGVELLDKFRYI